MKTIVAFIRSSKEEPVREALHDITGVSGATFSDVRGFGRGRGHDHSPGSSDEVVVGTLPKVRVEVMVSADHADAVAAAIASAARTGNRGDGKVYVLPVESALRISTGEIGASAL
ncbi:P-II family nitrogen regulator [Oleiharenicola sp. Vm1]|uniref:P-II family nitrogen regulator n=1 Tax=Oleiharenicola sp. Vm1 TaxID=3398393 RepID=UPI0039F5E495